MTRYVLLLPQTPCKIGMLTIAVQVGQELKKMTAFIKQEAMEKAREIEIKADEEFAIEKSKLVREETSTIDASYEKKFKAASMSQQITRSTVSNKTRLKVLSARQEILDGIFEAAQSKLGEATKDQDKYEQILKNLMLEGFYALNEKKVQIRVREADKELAQKAIEDAKAEYKNNVNKDIEVTIDENQYLSEGWYVYSIPHWGPVLTVVLALVDCPLLEVVERLISTTHSMSACACSRILHYPPSATHSSERTRTESSTTKSLTDRRGKPKCCRTGFASY